MLINADSAQVYRDLRVLSAGPSEEDLARAEHRLYFALDGAQPCSAADWSAMARREIADIHASGRLPILVGGTGMYLRTLLDGIAPVPPIDPEIRQSIRKNDVSSNYDRLRSADPEGAERLKPSDKTRIARALEVVLSTGRTLSEWQRCQEGGVGDRVALQPLILLPPRDWLHRRCDARFAEMMERGALEEVAALLSRDLDPDLPVMRAIGVREIAAHIRGEISRDQAVTLGQQATRQYAKRQYTWFKHQPPPDWPRFEQPIEADIMDAALELLIAWA